MAQDNMRRLIDLAQKTGDTLIVTDKDGHEPVVIMDVSKYEALLDLGLFQEESDFSYEDVNPLASEMDELDSPLEMYAPEVSTPSTGPIMEDDFALAHQPVSQGLSHGEIEPEGVVEEDGEERFYLEPLE